MTDFDCMTEIGYDFMSGRHVLHVRYRPHAQGHRTYTRLTLVPDVGESFDDACAKIMPAVEAHYAGNVRAAS